MLCMNSLEKSLINLADDLIKAEKNLSVKQKRMEALDCFAKQDFNYKSDNWLNAKIDVFLKRQYQTSIKEVSDIQAFSCEIDNIESNAAYLVNGNKLINNNKNLGLQLSNIVDVTETEASTFAAAAASEDDCLYSINTAAFTGGFFLNIPDNTVVELPLQLISVNNQQEDSFYNIRNLIKIGDNSQVKIIQCDDSVVDNYLFINNITEIFVGKNSHLDLYKMYNLSNSTAVVNSIFIEQKANSVVNTYNFELNAGLLRSKLVSKLIEQGAESYSFGIYLVDKQQYMSNLVDVEHLAPNCKSEQIFKGIVDDLARAVFNGKIVVHKDAQKTIASQVNRNILLSEKAKVNSKPYLEIYADDVKCSHGTTVGQLNEEALFYMQARGISVENARRLLLNAFIGEVIDKIHIEPIKVRMSDLVKKRLNGELSKCNNCIIRCSDAQLNDADDNCIE